MEWALRKKGIPEVIIGAVMSFDHGAKAKFRVGTELSEKFSVQVGAPQGCALSPLLFTIVMDVITEHARNARQIKCQVT